jgi:hypothetical protein
MVWFLKVKVKLLSRSVEHSRSRSHAEMNTSKTNFMTGDLISKSCFVRKIQGYKIVYNDH